MDEIRRAAFDQAAKTGTLDDLEKAASIAKSLAEAQKSASEASNADRQLRFQRVTSFSTFLVPIVSLVALLATIYIQSQQLRETRDQNIDQLNATRQQTEDTQWRDLLTSLRGSADSFDSDVTVAPRLRSFFQSPRYGDQARDISIRLMGRLTNLGGFKDLYGIVFADMTPNTFAKIVDVDRGLNDTRNSMEVECFNLSVKYQLPNVYGLCNIGTNIPDLARAINAPFPARALQLRQALPEVYAEIFLVSQTISSYLRSHFSIDNTSDATYHSLDLSYVIITNVDLSNVDFRNINLRQSRFGNDNFYNADLRLSTPAPGMVMNASNWWDASKVDQNLLTFMTLYQYPFWDNQISFAPWRAPTLEHYRERVAALCQPARPDCLVDKLKFGPPAKTNIANPSDADHTTNPQKYDSRVELGHTTNR